MPDVRGGEEEREEGGGMEPPLPAQGRGARGRSNRGSGARFPPWPGGRAAAASQLVEGHTWGHTGGTDTHLGTLSYTQ